MPRWRPTESGAKSSQLPQPGDSSRRGRPTAPWSRSRAFQKLVAFPRQNVAEPVACERPSPGSRRPGARLGDPRRGVLSWYASALQFPVKQPRQRSASPYAGPRRYGPAFVYIRIIRPPAAFRSLDHLARAERTFTDGVGIGRKRPIPASSQRPQLHRRRIAAARSGAARPNLSRYISRVHVRRAVAAHRTAGHVHAGCGRC